MRSTILLKVLFEKRRGILLWAGIILVANAALALLFPAIRDTLGSMMATVPPGMENWFGDTETWQTYTGYASQELFGEMAVVLIIMSVLFGASFLAGYEGNGTLLTLLSRPVSRQRVFFEKYSAFVLALLFVSVAFYVGVIVGGLILGEPVEYLVFAECMLMVFLLSLAFGSITYAIGAITGKSGVAGIIVGVYALVAYLLASLSTATDIVDKLSYGSLFRYAAAPTVVADGLNLGHIAILLGVAAVSTAVGAIIFVRRDLKTR